jgi:hypothetical protein
VQPNI